MKLTQESFNQLLGTNSLVISLIGMSNIGKTVWSKKLATQGFDHYDCDEHIEKRLLSELKELDFSGIEDVARWMGKPTESHSQSRQDKYLTFEKAVLENIIDLLQFGPAQNTVIDTTGSFVHAGNDICSKLPQVSFVTYLQASPQKVEELFLKYLAEPKPVVFGNMYTKLPGEDEVGSLKRSYLELLNYRSMLYEMYADVVIPVESLKKEMTPQDFFALVKSRL